MSEQKNAGRHSPEEVLHTFENTTRVDEQILVEALKEAISQRNEARRFTRLEQEVARLEAEMKADSMSKEDYLRLLKAEMRQMQAALLQVKVPTCPPTEEPRPKPLCGFSYDRSGGGDP